MKIDMDLVRSILLKIENEHEDNNLYNLKIEGYNFKTVAYHCQILEEKGYILSFYKKYADDGVYFFSVGGLTLDGSDYLNKIRDDSLWDKIKSNIKEKGCPLIFETVNTMFSSIASTVSQHIVS